MESKAHDASPSPAYPEASPAAYPPPPAETLPEAPRRRQGVPKRKASALSSASIGSPSSSGPPSKRQAKERNALYHLLPQVHNGPCTRARQPPNKLAAAAPLRLPEQAPTPITVADDEVRHSSADGVKVKSEEEQVVEEPLVDLEFEAVRSRGANVHAIPTPAGWFSWNTIHPIEKHMLASFFNGKSDKRTPEVYMEIRNSIMKKFHAEPQTQVELRDFPDLSVGDMDARQEIMEFLDHWGLINFHPFPLSKPEDSKLESDNGGKASSLLEKLYQFETIQPLPRFAPKKEESSVSTVAPCFLPESALVDELVKPVGPSVEYHCNSCSGDCSRKRYHCQKQADFDLCTDCYNDGKFDSDMTPTDFILMESADIVGVSGASWTDQETLLLLEALELFGENWSEIAEHVATKTKTQCILHFLQMPIEDSFLEGDDHATDTHHDDKEPTSPNKKLATANTPEKMEVETEETKNESPTKDAPEAKQVEDTDSKDQSIAPKVDASEKKSAADIENLDETSANVAINVLKAAFKAVSYFSEQQELGSFADAGNPVMALAAFLAGLVEPDVITTSCRGSLMAMSEESPGIQLATRHCFLLEDPPNDRKDSSVVSFVTCLDNEDSRRDEEKVPHLHDTEKSKDNVDNNNENAAVLDNNTTSSVSIQDCSPKQIDARESSTDLIPSSETLQTISRESADQPSSQVQFLSSKVKDIGNSASPVASTPSSAKETEDLAFQGEAAQSDEKEANDPKSTDEEKPGKAKDSFDLTNVDGAQLNPDSSKIGDPMSTSVNLEAEECLTTTGATSKDESKEKPEEGETKESQCKNEKICSSTRLIHDHNMVRLKRAAITALSAAAVKAKLLAKHEEDDIRQLVSLIIDKQLQKLEAKVAFFAEIENVVMRVREQTERARQRLLHERSQIIAARLGAPASSFRGNPASLPASRMPMGYGLMGPKLLNMASQRPPMRRP